MNLIMRWCSTVGAAARQTWRGLFWSPRCGSHPGTLILAALVVVGAVSAGLAGAAVMLALFGPVYLVGAYDRGRWAGAVALVVSVTAAGCGARAPDTLKMRYEVVCIHPDGSTEPVRYRDNVPTCDHTERRRAV